MKKLKIDVSKCSGCGQCALTCAFKTSGTFDLGKSAIRVLQWEDFCLSVPVVCQQCDDARCIWACPAEALSRHPVTGAIMVDVDNCINCDACRDECTYMVTRINESGLPVTCDLCNGDPLCVKACFPGALTFEEVPAEAWDPFRPFVDSLNARYQGKHVPLPEGLRQLGDLLPPVEA